MRLGLGLGIGVGGGAPPWTPAALGSSLLMWLRADSGVTLNGATVSAWADRSATGRNASQADAAKQPTYTASDANLNGMPSLSFDGTADHLVTLTPSTVAQPVTLMVVAYADANVNRIALDGADATRLIMFKDASSNVAAYAGATIASTTTWISQKRAMLFEANGASSAIYLDGFTTPIKTGNAGAVGFKGATIGAVSGGTGQWWSGSIGDVVAVSGASAAIRTNLMRYAAARYAITLT